MGNCAQFSALPSDVVIRPVAEVGVSCSAYGVRIGFETSSALSRYLPTPLIPGARIDHSEPASAIFSFEETRSPNGNPLFVVGENGVDVFSSEDINVATHALESRAHHYVAATAQKAVFVHAGVVSWRGKAILIPGRSHSGKSTLVMALVKAGCRYYSDEYAVLDAQGCVHPFARRPHLRPDFLGRESITVPSPDDVALRPLPVGLVLNTRYSPTGIWQPRRLTGGETLLALLENTVAVRRQAELSVKALKNTVASAIGLLSERAEAADVADRILQLIDESWSVSTSVTTRISKEETE